MLDFQASCIDRNRLPVRVALLAIAVSLTVTAAAAAEVYRSVDADGNVSYSDRPVGENSEPIYIATQRPASAPAAAPSSPAAAAEEPPDDEAPPEAGGPTPEELAEQRASNCRIARERLERYLMSRRLYRTDDAGEREYLSDAEIDEARARAAADVENWCD